MSTFGQGDSQTGAIARERGYTLIEAIVVLSIALVMLLVGLPSMADLMATQRVKTGAFDLYAALAFARSEAIKRNATVDLTPKASSFANGWQILNGTTVLRDQGALAGVSLDGPSATFSYDPQGRLAAAGRIDFLLHAPSNATVIPRCVVVDLSGRASIRSDRNRDGNCVNG